MAFLIFAVLLSAVLTWVVVWRHRRPKSMEASIGEFSRGLEALAPRQPPPRHRGSRGSSSSDDEPGTSDPGDGGRRATGR